MNEKKKKIVMPDTLIIVAAVVLLMAILSWVIPSGSYDYHEVDVNGTIRNVAIDRHTWILWFSVQRMRKCCRYYLCYFLLLRNIRHLGKDGSVPCRDRNSPA